MLSDLVALTPPFLVCAAFLIAVGAFLKHEMRQAKKSGEEETDAEVADVSHPRSSGRTPSSEHARQGSGRLSEDEDPGESRG